MGDIFQSAVTYLSGNENTERPPALSISTTNVSEVYFRYEGCHVVVSSTFEFKRVAANEAGGPEMLREELGILQHFKQFLGSLARSRNGLPKPRGVQQETAHKP
jgi:hypothetical protein